MLTQLSHQVSRRVKNLLTWLQGFEESGHIGIDNVTLNTRNALREHGII